MTMDLSCHCGNIRLTVAQPPATLTSCNCSICYRYGTLWGYYAPDEVQIHVVDQAAVGYCWGDKYLDFMHCAVCGCMTHSATTDKASEPRVAVNFRMAPPDHVQSIPVRRFDGADTWKFLED